MAEQNYRLKKSEGNFIDLEKERIFLNIPAPFEKGYIQEFKYVTRKKLKALLLWINGPDVICSVNKPVKGHVYGNFTAKKFKFDLGPTLPDPQILVAIYVDNEGWGSVKEHLEGILEKATDIHDAKTKFREGNSNCKDKRILMPKENDGDVIGGR